MKKNGSFWLIMTLIILGQLIIACQKTNFTQSTSEPIEKSDSLPNTEPEITIPPYPPSDSVKTETIDLFSTLVVDQIFIDPAGWFSVRIPAEWQSTTSENGGKIRYSGETGFFETGILPEMSYMPDVLNVCVWLANIDADPQLNKVIFGKTCQVMTKSDSRNIVEWIIENPYAELDGRYFYIRSDEVNFEQIKNSFQWLRSLETEKKLQLDSIAVRPVDIEFWKNAKPENSDYELDEYLLKPPEGETYDTSKMVFFIPPGAKRIEKSPYVKRVPPTLAEINKTLKLIGFNFTTGSKSYFLDLYQENEIVIENIYKKSDIYTIPTSIGNKIAFIVYALKDENISPYQSKNNANGYLIEDGKISIWKEGPEEALETWQVPLLINDRLLWVQAAKDVHVEVLTSDRERVFSFAAYFGAHPPINQFRQWGDHWILEIDDFLIQDGVILNEYYSFEQAFTWRLFKGKPFFFFRKGSNLGISYDGQFHYLNYEEIFHGSCCEIGLNNPINNENMLRFYGRRGEDWYYVILNFGER